VTEAVNYVFFLNHNRTDYVPAKRPNRVPTVPTTCRLRTDYVPTRHQPSLVCTDRGRTMHQLSRRRTDLVPSTRTGCIPTSYQQSVPIVYQPMFQSTVSVPLVYLSGQLRTNCEPESGWKLFLTCTINVLESVLPSYRLCS